MINCRYIKKNTHSHTHISNPHQTVIHYVFRGHMETAERQRLGRKTVHRLSESAIVISAHNLRLDLFLCLTDEVTWRGAGFEVFTAVRPRDFCNPKKERSYLIPHQDCRINEVLFNLINNENSKRRLKSPTDVWKRAQERENARTCGCERTFHLRQPNLKICSCHNQRHLTAAITADTMCHGCLHCLC